MREQGQIYYDLVMSVYPYVLLVLPQASILALYLHLFYYHDTYLGQKKGASFTLHNAKCLKKKVLIKEFIFLVCLSWWTKYSFIKSLLIIKKIILLLTHVVFLLIVHVQSVYKAKNKQRNSSEYLH